MPTTLHYIYVTGFAKTRDKSTDMKATLLYPETPLTELHIAGSAFTYWHCVYDLVNPQQSTVGCTVPLGRTDKATLGGKLLPTTFLA